MPAKTIVITGASDGIGASSARQLTDLGHRVVVVGRNAEKTKAIATELGRNSISPTSPTWPRCAPLAAELLAAYPRIDVLANNAGGIFSPVRETTVDGFELTFQVNYLAPFLLTQLLLDRLLDSQATVVNTSSLANRLYGRVDLDDLNAEKVLQPQPRLRECQAATDPVHPRIAETLWLPRALRRGIPPGNCRHGLFQLARRLHGSGLRQQASLQVPCLTPEGRETPCLAGQRDRPRRLAGGRVLHAQKGLPGQPAGQRTPG